MTDLAVSSQEFPNLLDGNSPCPGQNEQGKQQGKFYSQFQDYLERKYPEFLPYLDVNELAIYDEGLTYYKFETSRDRALKGIAWSNVIDKIPEDVLYSHYQRIEIEFQKRMSELRQKKKSHAGYELGAREFTLTYSPKWFSDEEARKQMTKAINKIIKYYKDGDQRIISLRAIGEVGTNGLSHVHCFYKLLGGVKITDKNFKRAYSPWDTKIKQGSTGHKGGHHASVKHESDFLGYIEKEVATAWLDISYPEANPT